MAAPSRHEKRSAPLRIQLLGQFAVWAGQERIPDEAWRLRRARSLVKLLALAPGHRLHRDQVADTLWPDSDLSASANNFHQTLHAARRILESAGAGHLPLEDGFLRLCSMDGQPPCVDVEQFEDAAAAAKGSQDPAPIQAAIDLYPGDLLPEDRYEEWTLQRREALRLQYLNLLLALAQLLETHQAYPRAIETLERLLSSDRANEEAHTALMRLYALSGRRGQALRQFQALREALLAELEAEPGEAAARLLDDIQANHFPPQAPSAPPPAAGPRHNLPAQLTSFIGRETQIDAVCCLARDQRLVTLTGAGGTGKTRLALQAAERLLEQFPHGAWLVELAPLSDPALVPRAVAASLGVLEQPGQNIHQSLVGFLQPRSLLLILDNCEHVIDACTQLVDTLLKACPKLHFLATSREILSVPGEHPFRVPSLEVPDLDSLPTLDTLAQVEAVRLFAERAVEAAPGFTLSTANAPAVAQVVQRVDGIPLAIELAAARVRMMTPEQIAARLDGAFRLLTGGSRAVLPRHQTLKALIDWSYNLLAPKERLLLQRLSVFAGGWTLEAAEAVCADPGAPDAMDAFEVMDLLSQLVDKSLVIAEPTGHETRYRMLETIRQYARERLFEAGGGEQVRDRHLAYFARLSGQAEPHLRGKGQIEWLNRIEAELGNLRVALDWSLGEDVEQGLKIMADLTWFWWIRAIYIESIEWLRRLLASETAGRGYKSLENGRALQRARGLRAFYVVSLYISSDVDFQAIIKESISILRRSGSLGRRELGISLYFMSWFSDLLPAEEQEMLEIFRENNEQFYLSEHLWSLAQAAFWRGDVQHGEVYTKESLSISQEIEDFDGIWGRKNLLGDFAILAGDYPKAEAFYAEAEAVRQKVGNRVGRIEGLVRIKMVQGQYAKAAQLTEMTLKEFREMSLSYAIPYYLKLGMVIAWAGADYQQANRLGREVLENYPQYPTLHIEAFFYLGRVALAEGDLAQAEALFTQSTSLAEALFTQATCLTNSGRANYSNSILLSFLFLGWAALFCKQGKLDRAASVLGAVEDIYQRTKNFLTPRERSEQAETLAATNAALGEEAFSAAWQEGQALTPERALQYVLECSKIA